MWLTNCDWSIWTTSTTTRRKMKCTICRYLYDRNDGTRLAFSWQLVVRYVFGMQKPKTPATTRRMNKRMLPIVNVRFKEEEEEVGERERARRGSD